jgi:hypothetical protein
MSWNRNEADELVLDRVPAGVGLGRTGRPKPLDSVMEPGVGGRDRDLQGVGRLARRQADAEAQDQDRPLDVVQATESSFDLIAIGELRRAIGLGRIGLAAEAGSRDPDRSRGSVGGVATAG